MLTGRGLLGIDMNTGQQSTCDSLEQAAAGNYRRLVQALLHPACYPHPVDHVDHIETHISDVLLTGPYAYKLKKPLDLGFLDFSTLEKRRRSCDEEIRLNRRLAPDLYLGVVPITGDRAHPRAGGEGVALEYAVQMRQFDQAGMLGRVLARDELTGPLVDEIAQDIAAFHLALSPSPADGLYGQPRTIMGPALQNFDQLLQLAHSEDEHTALDWLQRWTVGQHARLEKLFGERHRDGFVRECHGDLHLGNMVLIDGRVRIFDGIEFSPELRWIDVMNEVAFLTMDLIQHQRSDLAYRFLDRYLQITGDYPGLLLLRYYMVYRALVRAKVAAMRAVQTGLDEHAQRSLQDKRRTHVMLAKRIAQSVHPKLAILHGLSGSGKTVVSQIALETTGAIRIRSDVERKRLHGLSIAARSKSAVGEGLYTASAGNATYERLTELAAHTLDAGFPVLVDAAFLKREQRERMRQLAELKHVPFVILHIDASETTLRRRIAQREADGADASEASGAVLDWQLVNQEPLTEAERVMTRSFDTERQDSHAVAERARQVFQALDTAEPAG
jgi:aminoglycoside phosphotransferase family enzyme/predicted kinase